LLVCLSAWSFFAVCLTCKTHRTMQCSRMLIYSI
jgi:hypothetical protein